MAQSILPSPACTPPALAPQAAGAATSAPAAARELVDFWFGPEAGPGRWFAGGRAFDAALAARFGALVESAAQGELEAWGAAPTGALALLLLLDQLPRNVYRGTARAFATDPAARRLAERMLADGTDQALSPRQRLFVALPLEHAEDPSAQAAAVAYLAALERAASDEDRVELARASDYARRHRDVIARFGRFPGRNEALGRTTTDEERAALARGEAAF